MDSICYEVAVSIIDIKVRNNCRLITMCYSSSDGSITTCDCEITVTCVAVLMSLFEYECTGNMAVNDVYICDLIKQESYFLIFGLNISIWNIFLVDSVGNDVVIIIVHTQMFKCRRLITVSYNCVSFSVTCYSKGTIIGVAVCMSFV